MIFSLMNPYKYNPKVQGKWFRFYLLNICQNDYTQSILLQETLQNKYGNPDICDSLIVIFPDHHSLAPTVEPSKI